MLTGGIAVLSLCVTASTVAVGGAAAQVGAVITSAPSKQASLQEFAVTTCLTLNSQPIIARVSSSRLPDGCWPAGTAFSTDTLEVESLTVCNVRQNVWDKCVGLAQNEPISGVKEIYTPMWIGKTNRDGIKGSGRGLLYSSHLFSQNYPNGSYLVEFSLRDSSSRTSLKSVTIQIFNSTPSVIPGEVSMTAPRGSGDTSSATIEFQALPAAAATVELLRAKNPPISVDVDLSTSVDGIGKVVYDKLEPSTKYRYRIVARNANGQSLPVTGSFKTPDVPKAAPRSGSSSASSGSRSSGRTCPIVLNWRLDRAESALRSAGCAPVSLEHPSCRAAFGILRKSKWQVVAQRGNTLLACQN